MNELMAMKTQTKLQIQSTVKILQNKNLDEEQRKFFENRIKILKSKITRKRKEND